MAAAPVPRLNPEEYLAQERNATYRSEYIDGYVYAMAGGSVDHATISANLIREISNRLKSAPCRVCGSDLRVQIQKNGGFFYPDVSVICGKPEYSDKRNDTVTNPAIIVEVLSPSTESRDRGIKFANYRRLASLKEYILVDQNAPRIERFARTTDNAWLLTETSGLDTELEIAAIECRIPLAEIYDKVEFTEPVPEYRAEP